MKIKLSNLRAWPYSGANRSFKIFELGLITVQIEVSKFSSLALFRCKSKFQNFRAWPYYGANQSFEIFELSFITVQTNFQNFRAWPYFCANRLGLIAERQGNFILLCVLRGTFLSHVTCFIYNMFITFTYVVFFYITQICQSYVLHFTYFAFYM